ncbi:trypsin [Comamonas serinivorans]|uniref:Trypsin n=1 Tax=Comamonas serinivorans TaxID=1082851 RepID=A0A1Y0EIE3_9BURK|nr:VIT domain-containing protein [Comamonas serinivorans]ARU03373.1 trypsin [Comamonas serinivorans]
MQTVSEHWVSQDNEGTPRPTRPQAWASARRGWRERLRTQPWRAGAVGLLLVLQVSGPAQAQPQGEAPARTEAPYFFLPGADPQVDALPLKGTQVDVRIAGVIADVTVTQTYKNEGTRPIEAKYVFPGSTRAAVHAMNVRLGERLITAQIKGKEQARIEYTQAKQAGKTAALLEQHRPNVFQMAVANILPGDDVKVELRYTELLVPEGGRYQFVFPTVVGPRYNSPSSLEARSEWVAQPTQAAGRKPLSAFDLKLRLEAPLPIAAVGSKTHRLTTTAQGDRQVSLALDDADRTANNRDFILDYSLAGQQVASGLMLMQGEQENFFLAMVQPPKAVALKAVNPREYIFVVDISGSMHGFPLDTAKAMLRELIGGLRPSDTFNVMLFSGSNSMLNPHSVPATQANIEGAIATIERMQGGGSTELMPALKRVYAQAKSPSTSRSVVVVTDGYVTVESEAFALIRKHLDEANVFAFGIGSSVNRHLIEGMARAGRGEPFVITSANDAKAQADRFRQLVAQPVLTSVQADFEGVEVYDVVPEQLPDVLAERPVVVFGKWRPKEGQPFPGRVRISGQTPAGPFQQVLPLADAPAEPGQNTALRQLWARERIAMLSDQEALDGGSALREQIMQLGLGYSLLTNYTSFIAVDEVVRVKDAANTQTVNQPLPMPEGVSNLAVAAQVPSAPEPQVWGAMAVCLSMLGMLARRKRKQRKSHYTS